MFTTILRCLIIYFIVFIIFRFMGKRQLGQLQPFEFVITLIIADLATLPMADRNIPIISGILPLIVLLIVQFSFSVISRKSLKIRRILNGKPVIIVTPNGIEYEKLKELNMNLSDLQEGLRTANYFNIDDVAYALVETNGTITVLPKSAQEPTTREDLNISTESNEIPLMIICDGKVIKENLKTLNFDNSIIEKVMNIGNAKNLQDVVIATLDKNSNVFIQIKNQKYITGKVGG